MTKSKKNLVVCISGYGSNLQAIIDACNSGVIDADIVLTASNKKNAFGLERAKKAGIKTFVSKEVSTIFDEISKYNPDLIALAGFMKIIPAEIVKKFKKKIINIHPSLLPKFPGLHSIERAYNAGELETGVTVHYVDEGVDTGEIIVQDRIPIDSNDSLENLEKRIHSVEHFLYPNTINKLLKKS